MFGSSLLDSNLILVMVPLKACDLSLRCWDMNTIVILHYTASCDSNLLKACWDHMNSNQYLESASPFHY